MKKIYLLVITLSLSLTMMCGCNKSDTQQETTINKNTETVSSMDAKDSTPCEAGMTICSFDLSASVLTNFNYDFYDYTASIITNDNCIYSNPDNTNIISGSFSINLLNSSGEILDQLPLYAGAAVSELGITIDIAKEGLEKSFLCSMDKLMFSVNADGDNFFTSIYQSTPEGKLFRYECDNSIEALNLVDADGMLITSSHFEAVANYMIQNESFQPMWYDIIQAKPNEDAHLVFYRFDSSTKLVSVFENYTGTLVTSGDEYDALIKGLTAKYKILPLSANLPLESEDIIEVTRNSDNIVSGYCQVDTSIATTPDELVDYVADAFADITLTGYNSKEELHKLFFETPADTLSYDSSLGEFPYFKVIDGKLCYINEYDGVPLNFRVPTCIMTETSSTVHNYYFIMYGLDSIYVANATMTQCEDGKWRLSDVSTTHMIND